MFVYHDLRHTFEVAQHTHFLGKRAGISDHDLELLEIAAWMHDTGYVAQPNDHEAGSVLFATPLLSELGVDPADIEVVRRCIMVTKLPHNPLDLLEEILCDADSFHFGEPRFIARSVLLKHEWEAIRKVPLELKSFVAGSIMFLETHRFFTPYAKLHLDPGKAENILYLQALEQRLEALN